MKNIIIIGAGKRCRDDFLPALEASSLFNLIGIYARSTREIDVVGKKYGVRSLLDLSYEDIKEADWVYIAVPSRVLSSVLKFLSSFSTEQVNLLIDTPVIPWHHFFYKKYFKGFSRIIVAEDAIYLPWIEPLKKTIGGNISKIVFKNSVYRYHGIALAKVLIDDSSFKKVKLNITNGKTVIEIDSQNGTHVYIFEPRDYSSGSMLFYGPKGTISDSLPYTDKSMRPIIFDGSCTGLNIAGLEVYFSETESKLIGSVHKNSTITSMTLQLKRVGLLRMLQGLAEGQDVGWKVKDALADTFLDELVHRLGKYINIAKILHFL